MHTMIDYTREIIPKASWTNLLSMIAICKGG